MTPFAPRCARSQRLFARAVLVALLATCLAPAPHPAQAGPDVYQLVVDCSGDFSGGACTGEDIDCSLRSAIELANAYAGAETVSIVFDNDYTIFLASNLPAVTHDHVTIAGASPDGWPLTVKINRNAAPACAYGACPGLAISGSHIQVIMLLIYGAGAGSPNLHVTGSAHDVTVYSNVLGDDDIGLGGCGESPLSSSGLTIDATGAWGPEPRVSVASNVIECNQGGGDGSGYGIIVNGSDGVTIGASATFGGILGNYIRLNAADGITLSGSGARNNVIVANRIGVNDYGTTGYGNGRVGIYGGSLPATTIITGNLISGNGWAGIWLNNTRGFTITHNIIGADISASYAIPNGHDGIALTNGTQYTLIGDLGPDTRNIISGNTFNGIRLRDGSPFNTILANYIGLDGNGTSAIPNGGAGIAIYDSDFTHIGYDGGVTEGRCYVAGNAGEGIYVHGSQYTSVRSRTYVGVASALGPAASRGPAPQQLASAAGATAAGLGNAREGILLDGSSLSDISAAVVFDNGLAGVAVVGTGVLSNTILPGEVKQNGGLPIDLGNDGPTPNDPGDADSGPNALLNYPEVTAYSADVITGTACANCRVALYYRYLNPGAPRGGGTYSLMTTADGAGVWHSDLPFAARRSQVALVATQRTGTASLASSEMSRWWSASLPLALRLD
jgi:parallel beta-helix repeat protein